MLGDRKRRSSLSFILGEVQLVESLPFFHFVIASSIVSCPWWNIFPLEYSMRTTSAHYSEILLISGIYLFSLILQRVTRTIERKSTKHQQNRILIRRPSSLSFSSIRFHQRVSAHEQDFRQEKIMHFDIELVSLSLLLPNEQIEEQQYLFRLTCFLRNAFVLNLSKKECREFC